MTVIGALSSFRELGEMSPHNALVDTFIVSDTLLRCTSWPGLHGSWVVTGKPR